jgi:hypothetical protein
MICPEHHAPTPVCTRRRHRQHPPARAQFAADVRAAVAAVERTADAAQADSGPVPGAGPPPISDAITWGRIAPGAITANTITAGNLAVGTITGYRVTYHDDDEDVYTWGLAGPRVTTRVREAEIEIEGERYDRGVYTTFSVTTPITSMTITTGTTGAYASTWASTTGNTATIMYDPYAGLGSGQPTGMLDPHRFETDEQRAAREERHRADRERWEVERNRRLAAERERIEQARAATTRAWELLESLLDADQRAELETRNTVTVVGSEGHRFRLECGHSDGNVLWLADDGAERGRMCAHPNRYPDDRRGPIPLPDVIIGQVLALRTDERGFVAVANHYSGEPLRYPRPSEEDEAAA